MKKLDRNLLQEVKLAFVPRGGMSEPVAGASPMTAGLAAPVGDPNAGGGAPQDPNAGGAPQDPNAGGGMPPEMPPPGLDPAMAGMAGGMPPDPSAGGDPSAGQPAPAPASSDAQAGTSTQITITVDDLLKIMEAAAKGGGKKSDKAPAAGAAPAGAGDSRLDEALQLLRSMAPPRRSPSMEKSAWNFSGFIGKALIRPTASIAYAIGHDAAPALMRAADQSTAVRGNAQLAKILSASGNHLPTGNPTTLDLYRSGQKGMVNVGRGANAVPVPEGLVPGDVRKGLTIRKPTSFNYDPTMAVDPANQALIDRVGRYGRNTAGALGAYSVFRGMQPSQADAMKAGSVKSATMTKVIEAVGVATKRVGDAANKLGAQKVAYAEGFCAVARHYGLDPSQLAKG